MGLLDILNGMQNGPRGQSTPAPAGSGGMSPIAMALLGLLAYKAIKHLSPGQTNVGTSRPDVTPAAPGPTGGGLSSLPGGLGGLLQGPLGGLLAGGAAGSRSLRKIYRRCLEKIKSRRLWRTADSHAMN